MSGRLRVLVACEYSGRVRDAFAQLGHDAWSCDLLPSERPGNHLQGDLFDFVDRDWDLLVAHPPCTYLASSGLHWNKRRPERAALTEEALGFVLRIASLPIPRIAIENPVGCLSTRWRKPDQIIQPWQFGEDASKSTCLWLKGLPPLNPTMVILKDRYANQTPSGQNRLGPSADRWKERSRTYEGIALAMAEQWGFRKSFGKVSETTRSPSLPDPKSLFSGADARNRTADLLITKQEGSSLSP